MTTWYNPYAGSGGHSSTTTTITPINPPLVFPQTGTTAVMGNMTITIGTGANNAMNQLYNAGQQNNNGYYNALQRANNNFTAPSSWGSQPAQTQQSFATPIPGWDYDDDKKAKEEGWFLYHDTLAGELFVKVVRHGVYDFHSLTTDYRFETNNMAYLYLMGKAESGSEFHKRALAIVEKYG